MTCGSPLSLVTFGPRGRPVERGTVVKAFPDTVIEALAKTSADVLAEIGESSPMAKEVHPAFILFRKKAVAYAAVADGAALAMRARALAM